MENTHLETTYPNCVVCGKTWSSLPDDPNTMWCSPEDGSHDTIWGFINKDGSYSFDLEMWGIGKPSFTIRWNCSCMIDECLGKNIVIRMDNEDYKIIKTFDPPIPYAISRRELIRLLKEI